MHMAHTAAAKCIEPLWQLYTRAHDIVLFILCMLTPLVQQMQDTQQSSVQSKAVRKLKATKLNGNKVGRNGRCGQCSACKAPDCGKCRYCLDKKKFGGPERLKKCCILRKCKGQEPQSNQSSTVELIIDKLRKS